MKSTQNLFLILASMAFIIVLGAAVYEHMAVIPKWSEAPPRSLSMFQGQYGLHPEIFWMVIHPITILCMIAALISNWKTGRRRSIVIGMAGYILVLVTTAIYYVPELVAITRSPYSDTIDESLLQRASLWEILSLIRLFFVFILAYIWLSALTNSTEVKIISPSKNVPLSYPNDSLGG